MAFPLELRFGTLLALFLGFFSLWARQYTRWLYVGASSPILLRGWFLWSRFHTGSVGVRGVFCRMELSDRREEVVRFAGCGGAGEGVFRRTGTRNGVDCGVTCALVGRLEGRLVGRLVGRLGGRLKGRCDGKLVSRLVRERLQKQD